MAYEATSAQARALSAVRGSAALQAAWRVFWPTRMAVLLVAVFAALSFGPAAGGLAAENAAKFDTPQLTHALADPLLVAARALGRGLVPAGRAGRLRGRPGARRLLPALPARGARAGDAVRRLAGRAAGGGVRDRAGRVPRRVDAALAAGLARAGPSAGATRPAAARGLPGRGLLRRAVRGEPVPAADRRGVLRRADRPLGLGRVCARRSPPRPRPTGVLLMLPLGILLVDVARAAVGRRRLPGVRAARVGGVRPVPGAGGGRRAGVRARERGVVPGAVGPAGGRLGRPRQRRSTGRASSRRGSARSSTSRRRRATRTGSPRPT